jgi:hypothetical protein
VVRLAAVRSCLSLLFFLADVQRSDWCALLDPMDNREKGKHTCSLQIETKMASLRQWRHLVDHVSRRRAEPGCESQECYFFYTYIKGTEGLELVRLAIAQTCQIIAI